MAAHRFALRRLLFRAALPLAALLVGPQASLQAQPQPLPAAPAPVVHAKPALWVVKDRDTTIYLFGTIHLLKPGITWFEGPVRKAFDKSRELVLEIADQSDPGTQASIARHALNAEGPSLTSQLPEALRPKFTALLATYGAAPTTFDRFKPWFAALTLTALPLRKLGYDSSSGVEEALRTAAATQGKTVIGLETSDEQIGLFDSLSQSLQMSLLVETINEQDQLEATIGQMIGAWTAGDPVKLAETLNQSMESDPALEKQLLFDRNERWATWIKARMTRPGTVFLAVGAGHLAGKGSVLDALAARKLKVKLVKVR